MRVRRVGVAGCARVACARGGHRARAFMCCVRVRARSWAFRIRRGAPPLAPRCHVIRTANPRVEVHRAPPHAAAPRAPGGAGGPTA
eukprot:3978943-Prymnesium_polylepis.1